MKNIRWVNKGRTFGVILMVVYFIALSNNSVQNLIGKAVNHIVEGSTIFCKAQEIDSPWWKDRV